MLAMNREFKTHVYGNDILQPCDEDVAVKLIVEMLLGSTNDLFQHQGRPLDQQFLPTLKKSNAQITIQVFNVTLYGSHLSMNSISRSLLDRVLKWFAQFGSCVYVCRTFSREKRAKRGDNHQLTTAVLETVQFTLLELLTSVDESLCDLENQVLRLPEGQFDRSVFQFNPKITLISLYQQCRRWESLFRSLAGVVCSTVPIMVGRMMQHTDSPDWNHENVSINYNEETYDHNAETNNCASTISSFYQSLSMRGIMQDLNLSIQLGGLIEYPRHNLAPVAAAALGLQQQVGRPSMTDEKQGISLHLSNIRVSGFHQYTKLLLSCMCSKYLLNLTGAVWRRNSNQPTEYNSNNLAFADSSAVLLALSRMRAILKAPNNLVQLQERRFVHQHLTFIESLRVLLKNNDRCLVPSFLSRITEEALVSAGDIQTLQKSHIQRLNPSYNYSRLKLLVQASIEAFHVTLLPESHHSLSSVARSRHSHHTGDSYNCDQNSSFIDPVDSYLYTGKSVKVVGIHVTKPRKTAASPSSVCTNVGESSVATAETTEAEQKWNGINSSIRNESSGESSSNGLTSNAFYLQELSNVASVSRVNQTHVWTCEETSSNVTVAVDDTVAPHKNMRLPLLMKFVPHSTRTQVTLLSSLSAQLQCARSDCAVFVRDKYDLVHNLRFIRDVYLLGKPDLYASVRECCLLLSSTSGSSSSSIYDGTSGGRGGRVPWMTENIFDAVAAVVRESVPSTGVVHVAVYGTSDFDETSIYSIHPRTSSTHRADRGSKITCFPHTSGGHKALSTIFREEVQSFTFTGSVSASSGGMGRVDNGCVREIRLLRLISSMCVNTAHEWPLTQFFTCVHYDALNKNLRFLLLLAACRWTAEYYWMDVVSNDSLGASVHHRVKSHQKHSNSNGISSKLPPRGAKVCVDETSEYVGDIRRSKRICRAGLGSWLHTITTVSNIFMGHIHRVLWPAFEEQQLTLSDSLLRMQHAFTVLLLENIDESLMLLRELILEVVVRGLSATCLLRTAAETETEEITLYMTTRSATSAPTTASTGGGVRAAGDVGFLAAKPYSPSSRVLVAYREAEEAFMALSQIVADLKRVTSLTIKSRAEKGLNERQDKALSELQLALA